MQHDTIEFDENGNFILEGDLEVQWMKLHRDIQTEYRMEQLRSFLRGSACVGVALAMGYGAIIGLSFLVY